MPFCLITDHDPTMKVAIALKFHSTTHRFYLWHIMRKPSEKVGCSLNSNTEFINRFKLCVYNSETTLECNILSKSLGWKRMNGCQNYLTFEICRYLPSLEICF